MPEERQGITIAVASGKGGTGKTTIATNLAWALAEAGSSVLYQDCDVEEPNGALYLGPQWQGRRDVDVMVPRIDAQRCTLCGKCVDLCQYNALVKAGQQVLVYAELCHSCGGCARVCPAAAIEEVPRTIGDLSWGHVRQGLDLVQGCLHIGEAMSPPLIEAVRQVDMAATVRVVDAPPGTSCPVIASVMDADLVLLVSDSTPFGMHDLNLAWQMVQTLNLPVALVINRAGDEDGPLLRFAADKGLSVAMQLPEDQQVARVYAQGQMLYQQLPALRHAFDDLAAFCVQAGQARIKAATAGQYA